MVSLQEEERTEGYTQGRQPHEGKGRDRSCAAISQGMPEATRSSEGARKNFSLVSARERGRYHVLGKGEDTMFWD